MTSTYEIAKSRVNEFDLVIHRDPEATDCLDCDARLMLGIEAFRWLEHLKQCSIRQLHQGGDVDREYEQLALLYRSWIGACESILEGGNSHLKSECDLENCRTFEQCVAKAYAFLAAIDAERMQDEAELSPANAEALKSILGL